MNLDAINDLRMDLHRRAEQEIQADQPDFQLFFLLSRAFEAVTGLEVMTTRR